MSPSSINLLVDSPAQPTNTIWGLPDYIWRIVIAICLLISALFSASENAFSNCNKYHFKVLADEGKVTAKIIVKLVEKFDNTLITILIGNNIVQTFMSYLSAMIFYNICQNYGLGNGLDAILSTVIMALLVYIISDTVPKIISKEIPNRLVYFLAYPVFTIGIILTPISILFKGVLTLVHKIFKIKEDNILTREDFIMQADEAIVDEEDENGNEKEEELFEPNEIQLLNRAFYFDSIYVKEVLTPKYKIFAVDLNGLTCDKLNKIILDTTFSRIPVYDGDIDHIIGILTVKNYFKEYEKDPHLDIRSCLSKPLFVDYSAKVDDIFKSFNREKKHIAIVKENDKVIGMITMEDVLEELVGEINEKKANILKEASRKWTAN